ncbi:MAG: glycosyltransferase family 2 protein [Candidatus Aminicenantales bacterium]
MSHEPTGPPLVSLCLVNYNDAAHLPECLKSVGAAASGISFEVIVVDNSSSDGSCAMVEKDFPGTKLIRNAENEGFGRANNRAARESRGEFLLFLNTDVILRPGTLEPLLEEMRVHPSTGIAAPALVGAGDRPQVSFGGRVTFFTEMLRKTFLNRMIARRLRKDRRRREVRWVSGAFLLARRSVFLESGGFDERFFLYFEDIDLCLRTLAGGWKVVFLPRAESFHCGGVTTAGRPLRSRLEYRKSQVYFYQKHNSPLSSTLLRFYLRLNVAGLILSGAFRKDADGPSLRREFRGLVKGGKA